MPTYSITTLGCKVNQFEAESIASQLEEAGYVAAKADENADLCIINTCTVTQKASMQSRQTARQAVRANPNAKIVVTGCYAQMEPEAIRPISGVDLVIGQLDKKTLVERISPSAANRPTRIDNAPAPKPIALGVRNKTRPFLKIQDGCNAFCTYCIVPHARGRSRSMPVSWVFERLTELKAAGYGEIVLTGIHLGYYGMDLTPQTNLTRLLHDILRKKLIPRLRLSSVEPKEITDEMIRMAADSQIEDSKLCRHFHIPLQSGDDDILKRMGRPYSGHFFKNLTSKIREKLPDAGIGADVLVGFPGESDRSFETTYQLLEVSPVTYLHVFPFSPRKGTPAYDYPEKVKPAVIKERAKAIRALGQKKKMQFCMQMLEREMNLLVEGRRDTRTGMLKGITSNYLPVLFNGPDVLMHRFVRIRIDKIDDRFNIYGTMLP